MSGPRHGCSCWPSMSPRSLPDLQRRPTLVALAATPNRLPLAVPRVEWHRHRRYPPGVATQVFDVRLDEIFREIVHDAQDPSRPR